MGFFLEHVVSPLEITTYLNIYFSLYPNIFYGHFEGKFAHNYNFVNSSGPSDIELYIEDSNDFLEEEKVCAPTMSFHEDQIHRYQRNIEIQ